MAVQQTTDISKFREQIVELRSKGLPWRDITDELAALGLDADHNAIVRYAQSVGIPTGRLKSKKKIEPLTTSQSEVDAKAAEVAAVTPFAIGEFISWATPPVHDVKPQPSLGRFEVPLEPSSTPEAEADLRSNSLPCPPLFATLTRATWRADESVLEFGDEDRWTLQDSLEGTLIVGGTGSGKTSGSGRAIAESFLALGFGGLVLTAKDDERALWEHYAERTGRSEQLCMVRPGGPFKFNFLDYQTRLSDEHGGSTENVVELFHSVLEAFSRSKRTVDSFWSNAAKQLLRNIVRIMRAAKEPFSLKTIRHFLSEMPRDIKAAQEGGWRKTPTFGRLIATASRIAGSSPGVDLEEAFRYWTADFPNLWHETRSTITADFAGLVDLFFEPAIYSLFGQETTLTPEAVFDGAIVVVDLSIKKHHATGRLAQLFWKHLFQLAVERRHDAVGDARRPVFLWADEAQYFVAETDLMFQATARSSRCATVYLTQTLPGFQAATGGDQSRERTDGLFANLTTKIIHANGDPATNKWAAEQVGRVVQYRASVTTNSPQAPMGFGFRELFAHMTRHPQSSVSTRPEMDFEIQPGEFSKLRTGSAKNNKLVDAIFMKSGACFSNGKHHFKATFQQE